MLSPSSISSSSWIGNLWPAQSSVGEEAATATRHESSMRTVMVRRWCSFFGVGELRIRMWRGGQGTVDGENRYGKVCGRRLKLWSVVVGPATRYF
jgi:hypothetical protein